MQRGTFADVIVQGLTTDVSLLDSIIGLAWSSDGKSLLIRVSPINPEAWREIGEMVVDNLRTLAQQVRFKARLQMLTVHGVKNFIFAVQPDGESPMRPISNHNGVQAPLIQGAT